MNRKKKIRLAQLQVETLQWISQRRVVRIEIGRRFIEIKRIVGHGKWAHYLDKKFGRYVSPRTARIYMQLARQADKVKSAESADLIANDPQAVTMRAATAQVEAAVAAEPPRIVRWPFPRTVTVTCRVETQAQESALREFLKQFQARVEVRRAKRAA